MEITAAEIDSKLKKLHVMYPWLEMKASKKVPQGDVVICDRGTRIAGSWIVNPEDLDYYIETLPYHLESKMSRVI